MYRMKFTALTLCLGSVLLITACQATPTPVITDVGPESCQDRVLVEVWSDLDGDGEKDAGEPLVEGALILLVRQDDPEGDNIQAETNSEGQAFFAGFEMDNCSPEGYEILFARSVPGFAFPENPIFGLNGFDMLHSVVTFGLLPESSATE